VGLGIKIAKLQIKMILALVLYRYDYKLVDGSGKPAKPPQVNMNDNHQVWPLLDLIVCHILNQLFPYFREDLWASRVSFGTSKSRNRKGGYAFASGSLSRGITACVFLRISRLECQCHEQLMSWVFFFRVRIP
jgi:hypothetical protein